MACNTETKIINDMEVSVRQWPAEKALLMKLKLIEAFGPSITLLASKESDLDETASLSKAIEIVFKNSSPEKVATLIKECVMSAAIRGEKLTQTSYENTFCGDNLMMIYSVFIFVLQVNYGNLLKGRLVGGLMDKMKGDQ